MTNEQILEQQVEALEKLLQLKQAIINELEAKISNMELNKLNSPYFPGGINTPQVYPQPNIFIPTVFTHDPCPGNTSGMHDYPNPWHGVIPPSCKYCGKQGPNFTVTSSSNNITLQDDIKDSTKSVLTLTTAANKK